MMGTRAQLLKAIQAAPDDDTLRLAFADHLDETAGVVPCRKCEGQGETRDVRWEEWNTCPTCRGEGTVPDADGMWAKLIRVSFNVRHRPLAETLGAYLYPDGDHYAHYAHYGQLVAGILDCKWATNADWSRGFIRRFITTAPALEKYAPAHREQLAVVREVVLTDREPRVNTEGNSSVEWRWWESSRDADSSHVQNFRHFLPKKIRLLDGRRAGRSVLYPTREAANDALAAAAALWCRRLTNPEAN